MKYPYPIKDWRDQSQYPKHDDLKQWAWEFLRRNAEYQEDVDKCKNGAAGFQDEYIFDHPNRNPERDDVTANYLCRSEKPEDEKYQKWVMEHANIWGICRTHLLISHFITRKYSLRFYSGGVTGDTVMLLPNPDVESLPPSFTLDLGLSKELFGVPLFEGNAKPENKYEMSFKFNLNKRLDWQLKEAELSLKEEVKRVGAEPKKPRKTLSKYINYLRVLDAIADGAKKKEIARELHPYMEEARGVKRVRDWLKAARILTGGGYLKMVTK